MKKILILLTVLCCSLTFFASTEKQKIDNTQAATQWGYYSPSTHSWIPFVYEGRSYEPVVSNPRFPPYWPTEYPCVCDEHEQCSKKYRQERVLISHGLFTQKKLTVERIYHQNRTEGHPSETTNIESHVYPYPTEIRWKRVFVATATCIGAAYVALKWFSPSGQESK